MVQMERMAMDSTSLKGLVATSTGDRLLWLDLCWEFVLPLKKCKCAAYFFVMSLINSDFLEVDMT